MPQEPNASDAPNPPRRVPTVFYLAVHHKPEQFALLLDAIWNPDDVFLVHIDAKATGAVSRPIAAKTRELPNVHLLPRRAITWGGWSQVAAELAAQRFALTLRTPWSYFVNLSGQDFPLRPITAIHEALAGLWPLNDIDVTSFDEQRQRDKWDIHLLRRRYVQLGRRRVATRLKLPRPSGIVTDVKGSQWHMLTRDFCQWLRDDPQARRVARVVKHGFIPDETFFQVAVMSSPFEALRTAEYHRFIRWPGPKVLGLDDLPEIDASGALFGRKFDLDESPEVLHLLARRAAEHGVSRWHR